MRRGNAFGRISLCVCASVYVPALAFDSLGIETSLLGVQVRLQNILSQVHVSRSSG